MNRFIAIVNWSGKLIATILGFLMVGCVFAFSILHPWILFVMLLLFMVSTIGAAIMGY